MVCSSLILEAAEKNDVAGLRRAQLTLAEANLLDSDGGDTSAKSCYYMGRSILALGAAGESQTFKARANAYFQIVVDHYPGSSWAAPASEELGK